MSAPPPPGDGAPLPAFRFQPRRGKLDWRSVSSLDLDRVMREVDIDALEQQLAGVAFAEVTREGEKLGAQEKPAA